MINKRPLAGEIIKSKLLKAFLIESGQFNALMLLSGLNLTGEFY
jgi:hypothetical protein